MTSFRHQDGVGLRVRIALAALFAAAAAISAARAEIGPQVRPKPRPAVLATPTLPVARPVPAFAFEAPVRGLPVTSRFGLRQLPFEPDVRVHAGVDIAAPEGAPVTATAPGVVARAGVSESYGRFVEIDHGHGVSSFYAHLSRTAGLRPGADVADGGVIGFVGSTGHSTGPHLHFEIKRDGERFDPSPFLGRSFAALTDLPFRAVNDEAVLRAKVRRGAGRSNALRRSASGRVTVTIAAG